MRVKLKDDNSIEFLDESGNINTNDVMVQYLTVEFETPPAKDESLWTKFYSSQWIYTTEILFSEEECKYSLLIPQEVLSVPGEWRIQLFVRLYSTTDKTKYITQRSSVVASFTVQNGLPLENGALVNNATIGNLYNDAKQAVIQAEESATAAAASARAASESSTAAAEESAQKAAANVSEALKEYSTTAKESSEQAAASAAEAGEYSAGAWRANDSAKTWAEQAGTSAAAAEKSRGNAASSAGAAAGDAARSQEARSEAERIIETAKMEFRYDETNEELTVTAYKQSIYKHVFQFRIEDDPTNVQVYANVYMVFFTNRSTAYTWEEAKALMMKYVGEDPFMPVSAENCPVDVFYEDVDSGIMMQVAGNARIHLANTEGMAEFLVTYPKINSDGTAEALAEVPMLLKDDESYYVDTFGEMVV